MASSDTEQRLQTPENTTEAASAKRQKFKERARAAKMISDKTGDATTEPAAKGGELVAERLQMVLERLYGPQYRAAQRFLKNRTLNKMNSKQTGMTLYERIMAYRKMKGDESPGEEGSSSRSGSQEASDTPPVKRKLDGSPQTLERSDTSFASVDISDLTNTEEEKNRTPTPPPTFEKPATSAKVLPPSPADRVTTSSDVHPSHVTHVTSPDAQSSRVDRAISSDARTSRANRATPSEVKPTGQNTVQPPAASAFEAWADSSSPPRLPRDDRRPSEKDRAASAVGRRLPAVDEQEQRSPVIKQLHPAYREIPCIVATNGRYSTFAYLFRSKSVPDIVLATDKSLSDNLDQMPSLPSSNSTGPRSRRENRKIRRSIQSSNDLNLAQKVLLARRVETYIATQELQRNLRETYEEKATARDVYVELDDKEDQTIRSEQAKRKNREVIRQTSDAYEEVTVHDENKVKVNQSEKVKGEYRETTETLEDERAQDARKVEKVLVVHKKADEVTRSVQEAEERTEKSEDRREDKRSDSRTERREEHTSTSRTQRSEEKVVNKHEERREDRVELAAVHKNVRREEIRSESRDDNHRQSASRSDSRKERREDNRTDSRSDRNAERHDMISKSAAITVMASESASSSKKSATERKSKTSDVKKSDERSSSRSSSKGDKSFLETAAEDVEASSAERPAAGSQDRPRADDPRKDKPKAAAETKARSDAPGAAAAKASTSREKRPDARAASRQAEKNETAQTIAALDKLADRTLNKLLGNEGGNDDEEDEADRKALEKAFSPEFQAELDNFLRTT